MSLVLVLVSLPVTVVTRAYPKQGAWLGEQVVPLVQRAPAEGQLGRVALPSLQVGGHPHDVEHREEHVADVLEGLVLAVAAELQEAESGRGLRWSGRAYPEEEADDGGDAQGGGVVAQPGEVHADFHAEVFGYFV